MVQDVKKKLKTLIILCNFPYVIFLYIKIKSELFFRKVPLKMLKGIPIANKTTNL